MAEKKTTANKPRVVTIIPGVPVPPDAVNAQGYLKDGALERIVAEQDKQRKVEAKALTSDPEAEAAATAEAEAAAAEEATDTNK